MSVTPAIYNFSDPEVQVNPYPIYERLRRDSPVFWNGPYWLVSRYDDIVALLNDPRVSSARVEATFAVLPEDVQQELQPLRHVLGSRMLLSDPPRHTRLRTLMTKAFSARVTEAKRERIEEICNHFLDRVMAQGTMDVMQDVAVPLPGWVIADMLGVPKEDQEDFTRWSRDQVRVYDRSGTMHERIPIMRQGQASMLAMKAYLEEVIAARRKEPREDLITMMIEAEEAGDRLTTDEMVVMCIALLVGGNNSTAHLIGNAILTLARHPEAIAQLRANPALIRPAIEEVMRYDSPVQATSRVAREPIEVGGQTIDAGQNIYVLFGSANRDEAQFPDPTRFDIARAPNRHLTFAHGPHFCLGAAVARAEAQSAVLTIVQRCADLQLASEHVEWIEGFAFRGPKSLPVTFRAG
jgi:pimeloyl-[acyl-carrier protein] synthase